MKTNYVSTLPHGYVSKGLPDMRYEHARSGFIRDQLNILAALDYVIGLNLATLMCMSVVTGWLTK